jgi:hypothetical protein
VKLNGYFLEVPEIKLRSALWEISVPAFFSASVSSFQGPFMRSRSCIHRSACSCGGIDSHRDSRFDSVGLERACACRTATMGRMAGVRNARRADWRASILGGRVEINGWAEGELNWSEIEMKSESSFQSRWFDLAGR